jgi:hypothetical protein
MGIGIGSIVKLARGGMGPDEMREMLSAMGINLDFEAVPVSKEAFTELGRAASLPSSKLIRLAGRLKTGERIEALMVVNQGSQQHTKSAG